MFSSVPPLHAELSFNKFTLFNCTLFKEAKHISLAHRQGLKVKEVEKDCKEFVVALEGGIFTQSLNSSDCYLRQILMPYSFFLSALECLLPPYKGVF